MNIERLLRNHRFVLCESRPSRVGAGTAPRGRMLRPYLSTTEQRYGASHRACPYAAPRKAPGASPRSPASPHQQRAGLPRTYEARIIQRSLRDY